MPFALVDVSVVSGDGAEAAAPRCLSPTQVASVIHVVAQRVKLAEARIVFVDAVHGAHLAVAELACAVAGVPFCPLADAESPVIRKAIMDQFAGETHAVLDSAAIEAVIVASSSAPSPAAAVDTSAWWFLRQREQEQPQQHPEGPAYFIGTSGSTTGIPRLVEVAAPELLHYVDSLAAAVDVSSSDRILLLTAPTFDPSIGDVFLAARTGATLVTAAYPHIAANATEVVRRADATFIVASPALWRHVDVSAVPAPAPGAAPPTSPAVLLGGERTPEATRRLWSPRVRFGNLYGVTEAVGYQALSWSSPDPDAPAPPDVGPPLGANRFALEPFDEEGRNLMRNRPPTPEGLQGCLLRQLVIYGPQVAQRYRGGRAFAGRHPTGDIAVPVELGDEWPDDDAPPGDLRLAGRRDFQVKLDGRRVCIEEVERLVASAPTAAAWLAETVCCNVRGRLVLIGVLSSTAGSGPVGDETAAATTVTEEKEDAAQQLPPTELAQRVLEALAATVLAVQQRPAACLIWPADVDVPMTANGKVDRRAVERWATATIDGVAVDDSDASGGDGDIIPAVANPKLQQQWIARHAASSVPSELLTEGDSVTAERLLACAVDIVADCYQRVFTVSVSPTTNFLLAGGDSMLALKVAQLVAASLAAIREGGGIAKDGNPTHIDAYGVVVGGPIGPAVVVRHPVVRDLALHLVTSAAFTAQDVACLDAGGAKTVSSNRAKPNGQAKAETASGAEVGVRWNRKEAALIGELEQLLLDVVAAGHVAWARTLVTACGADVNCGSTRATKRTSGLHLAAARPDAAMVRALIELGAKVTTFDLHHVTPAHLAAQRSITCLTMLLAAGAPPAIRDDREQGLLHHATRAGNFETVALLLGRPGGFDAEAEGAAPAVGALVKPVPANAVLPRDRWQRTPLHWAVVNGHTAIVKLFVDILLAAPGGPPKRKVAVSERLAKSRTHLKYESPREVARRIHGPASPIYAIVDQLGDDV